MLVPASSPEGLTVQLLRHALPDTPQHLFDATKDKCWRKRPASPLGLRLHDRFAVVRGHPVEVDERSRSSDKLPAYILQPANPRVCRFQPADSRLKSAQQSREADPPVQGPMLDRLPGRVYRCILEACSRGGLPDESGGTTLIGDH